eukprot:1272312-Prymnesium_polylepis.1
MCTDISCWLKLHPIDLAPSGRTKRKNNHDEALTTTVVFHDGRLGQLVAPDVVRHGHTAGEAAAIDERACSARWLRFHERKAPATVAAEPSESHSSRGLKSPDWCLLGLREPASGLPLLTGARADTAPTLRRVAVAGATRALRC